MISKLELSVGCICYMIKSLLFWYSSLFFVYMKGEHPSALSAFNQMINAAKGKQIVVFLDYDGTLSPIVSDPECAFMSDQVLKEQFPLFIHSI